MKINPMLLTDFYKLSHKIMSEKGTESIYSTMTPRGSRIKGIDSVVFYGLQGIIKEDFIEYFNDNFFNQPLEKVLKSYKRIVKNTIGDKCATTDHLEALHNLGFLPIRVKALPEGTSVPLRVPMFTVENTIPQFYWLTNFLETMISAEVWKLITVTTIVREYFNIANMFADDTCDDRDHVQWQMHNFSFRGLGTMVEATRAGAGHLVYFTGTDSLPSVPYLEDYYGADCEKELIGASIMATEHSIQCQYPDDYTYLKRMITEVAPDGMVATVCDGRDYWNVIGEVIPSLKKEIMARDGKHILRPDCYDELTMVMTDSGWKYFKELVDTDLVAQVCGDGSVELVKPLKYVDEHYEGEMCHFLDKKGKLDLLVTPNHRMVFKSNNSGTMSIREAGECKSRGRHGVDILRSASTKPLGLELSWDDRLRIMFQADGAYSSTTDGKRGTTKPSSKRIRASFSKPRKIERLKWILEGGGYEYKIYELSDGKVEFNIVADSSLFRKDFSWVDTKSLCSDWAKEFIEELSYWDATRRSDERFKFDTTVKSVINVVELIALSAGYGVLISHTTDNRKEIFSDVYTANILKNNHIGGQSIKKKMVNYSGRIYCVQVPTGKLLVKRNRATAVCGNSGDPVNIVCGTLTNIKDYTETCGNDLDTLECYVKEDLLEEIYYMELDKGECGPDEMSTDIKWQGKYYHFTLGDITWNRHDKTYYYHDQFGPYDFKMEEFTPSLPEIGSIQALWDIFGGTVNKKGYKVLDPHIGLIYGDAITPERAIEILTLLKKQGFAASNIVFGIGSYSLGYYTRDTFGMAIKATHTVVNGEERLIFKDPKTDDGLKKSQKGRVVVFKSAKSGEIVYADGLTIEDEEAFIPNLLEEIFVDGVLVKDQTLAEIRERVRESHRVVKSA